MYAAWKKVDDPPSRVEPVPMQILLHAAELAGPSTRDQATMDCIWIAFYFLLRPGEYANATGDAKHPFRLKDVQFKVGSRHFHDVMAATPAQLRSASYVSLTFTTQKNGVKGEQMAHASNGQPFSCPAHATLRRVAHLKSHHSSSTTPLHTYFDDQHRKRSVSSAMITSLLRAAALTIPGNAGVNPENVAARSLRASGAMALLLGSVDPDKIRILGRWRSDAMFRYLFGHALPLIQDNSSIMFSGGHYQLVTRRR